MVHPLMLRGLAEAATTGAEKHGHRWIEKPMLWGDHVAALFRHLEAFLNGQVTCPIDGQRHMDSVMWRAGALSVYERLRIGECNLPGWTYGREAYQHAPTRTGPGCNVVGRVDAGVQQTEQGSNATASPTVQSAQSSLWDKVADMPRFTLDEAEK